MYPLTEIGLAVPTFLLLKLALGDPVTGNDSPLTNPEYAAVPEMVADVLASYILLDIEIPVMVKPFAETEFPDAAVVIFTEDAPVLDSTMF